jgi:hypothetical protein
MLTYVVSPPAVRRSDVLWDHDRDLRPRAQQWAIAKRVKNVKESKGWGLYLWYPGEFDWWIPKSQQKR